MVLHGLWVLPCRQRRVTDVINDTPTVSSATCALAHNLLSRALHALCECVTHSRRSPDRNALVLGLLRSPADWPCNSAYGGMSAAAQVCERVDVLCAVVIIRLAQYMSASVQAHYKPRAHRIGLHSDGEHMRTCMWAREKAPPGHVCALGHRASRSRS